MVFMNCFNDKDLRKHIGPFIRKVCKQRGPWLLLERILSAYLLAVEQRKYSWKYSEQFWKAISFTRKKEDYDRVTLFWKKC